MSRVATQQTLKTCVYRDVAALSGVDADAALMIRLRDGDKESFTRLLDKHRGPVINFLYRMVQSHSAAEELAQEVFLRVYRSRNSYEPTAKFTTWLFRIATHLALNWIRDGQKERGQQSLDAHHQAGGARQVKDRSLNAEQKLLEAARLDEVRRAIQLLPPKQRAAVLMHKYEELEYSQIAVVLGCTESAVKSLLFRAYETLRVRLAHFR